MVHWDAASATDRGRVRRRNEDAILMRPDRRLYAVADGMGGHAAGNVASALAVETLDSAFPRAPSPRIGASTLARRMTEAFARANDVIVQRSASRRAEAGMGTTLTALAPLLAESACVIAHIGDSRAYRLRGGRLDQLTTDHTWVQQQVDAGALSVEAARTHPWSSILTRVLGMEQPGAADIIIADVALFDTFLLCSDGLTGMVSDVDIAGILSAKSPVTDTCNELVAAANASGGRDNISVVVLRAHA
jgi:protein phosphatase